MKRKAHKQQDANENFITKPLKYVINVNFMNIFCEEKKSRFLWNMRNSRI